MTALRLNEKDDQAEATGTTLALLAHQKLRQEIISAKLSPGQKLRIREICDRYDMGLSPVREALNRLASEGLVVQSAQRGFTVASFSLEDLEEINRTRRWLNELGIRESIEHGDAAWEERLVLAFHRLSRVSPYTDAQDLEHAIAWNTAHRVFHTSLLDACRSRWLIGFCEALFDASERYRSLARLGVGSRKTSLDEHRAIMDAALARDASEAVRLLLAHFDRTADAVQRNLEKVHSSTPKVIRRPRPPRP